MCYQVTLLKIASLGLIIYVIYLVIKYIREKGGSLDNWGGVYAIGLFKFGLTGLAIDWVLLLIFNYWVTQGIEVSMFGFIYLLYLYTRQEKVIVIPDNFKGYLTIVYNVKGEKPLYKYPFTLSYEIEVPDNGIKFTSTTHKRDIFRIRFRTKSGIFLNNSVNPNELHPTPYEENKFKSGSHKWHFKTWLINHENGWNKSIDIDNVTPKLMKEFCHKKSLSNQ